MTLKLKDILLGKHDAGTQAIREPLVNSGGVIRDEPRTHRLLLPLEVPVEKWRPVQLLLGNAQDEQKATIKLKALLIEAIKRLQ
jgi:hypothetical protein